MKFHREQLGRPVDVDLSQLTAMHFETIYGALLSLTDRCAVLEDVVNSLAQKNGKSRNPAYRKFKNTAHHTKNLNNTTHTGPHAQKE